MRATPSRRARTAQMDSGRVCDVGKRRTLKRIGALGALALLDAAALSSCASRFAAPAKGDKRLIILGVDGLDPGIAARLMAAGQLPNLSRMRETGGFRPLTSTVPPQSPVAWATVITGLDPGTHGICDFVSRDPATYQATSAVAETAPPAYSVPLGRWRVPLSQSRVGSRRRGRAFWDILAAHGVPCEVHRVPSNFPPADTGARQLAGLGTPDARGSLGTSSYFTDGDLVRSRQIDAQPVRVIDGRVRARLKGPRNSLERGMPDTEVGFEVWVDRAHRVAKLVIQGRQVLLRQGEWTDWVPVTFVMVPHVKAIRGICRFYMKEIVPRFKLYVTPINFDPMDPALPIDAPAGYARQLARSHGRFHTLGLPEDTEALAHGVLDEDEYLHQAAQIVSEARQAYESQLHRFRTGLLFCYFGTTDRNQHMFWRTTDPQHPAYEAAAQRAYGSVVADCYRLGDELAGAALEACDANTTVVLLSDHGFTAYYRQFNLNTWLASEGYLCMRDARGAADIQHAADWSQTAAYGIGLTGLYLNLKGREARGVISPTDREAVARRLARRLRSVRDPKTGERVIANVYLSQETYSATTPPFTPDLILGYASGYRCTSASGLGVVSAEAFKDNVGKWSGDHCIDRDVVPGLLLATKPIGPARPGLPDIPASALAEFGVEVPKEMIGKPIW